MQRQDVALIGEVGLGGELRPVPQLEKRLAEVAQLGFQMVYHAGVTCLVMDCF